MKWLSDLDWEWAKQRRQLSALEEIKEHTCTRISLLQKKYKEVCCHVSDEVGNSFKIFKRTLQPNK